MNEVSISILFIDIDKPGRPGRPEAVDTDKDHIKIKWAPPISNGLYFTYENFPGAFNSCDSYSVVVSYGY